ncbi:hypothetical protein Pure05_42390 [Paenarthrobacter ureafaciens]|nr:hypothetical protein Pure01_42410 [Paenarthrobacter ureafaciens]GLU65994.1 hypothetical protein Pure02_42440 [Paenarthrobacter ureafaciens]GLU69626.1 hypothetical protein Pure03_36020 [Paenarthrobacter ureafaciens]GLU74543.1 hypothetical protein Pure04_42580 [Paenarthrobacter ureafaciens]GLU78799.1 hypothetical protein Pure05_42390 [Paenarthrobacter ureafaciens]
MLEDVPVGNKYRRERTRHYLEVDDQTGSHIAISIFARSDETQHGEHQIFVEGIHFHHSNSNALRQAIGAGAGGDKGL